MGKRKKQVAFIVGSPPVKKARTEGVVVSDSQPATAGRSPPVKKARTEGVVVSDSQPATADFVSSFITPTSKQGYEDDSCNNVRMCPSSVCFIVLSSSSMDTDIPTSPQVVLHVPSTQVNVNVSAVEPSIEARDSSTLEDGAEALSATLPQLMTFMNLRLLIPLPL
nr:hypothetical protein [Tanacetum cinerariifolium]